MVSQIVLKLLSAVGVGAFLEGRPDTPRASVRIPAVDLCVTDDTREMGESGGCMSSSSQGSQCFLAQKKMML